MAKQNSDLPKTAKALMGAFQIDNKIFQDAAEAASAFHADLSKIALSTARKNAELTSGWAMETLEKVAANNQPRKDAGEYVTAASDFLTDQAQAMPEKLMAYVETAKAAQMQVNELCMSAGQSVQTEISKKAKAVAKAAS
ncbi:MAG: hypothetical protein CSA68_11435 [Rhodobacterales bacterium]|nr:MAG: hypothetical protein CSA68_11435 [Rhodobacterales bacterium]